MAENTLVTISKVDTPDFDIRISTTGHYEGAVTGDVQSGDWELVSVQGEKEPQAVNEEDLDSAVKQAAATSLPSSLRITAVTPSSSD